MVKVEEHALVEEAEEQIIGVLKERHRERWIIVRLPFVGCYADRCCGSSTSLRATVESSSHKMAALAWLPKTN